MKEKPSRLSCDQLAGSLWTRHLSSLQNEGGWTVHSFSLSTGHLLEQIQTCSAHKDGRATTEGMEHEADSRSGGEEIQPVGKRMRRRPAGSGERTKQGRERFSFLSPGKG